MHREFSHCQQNYYYVQAMKSSMALKIGGSVHIWTPTVRKWLWGVRTPWPPQDRLHWQQVNELLCSRTILTVTGPDPPETHNSRTRTACISIDQSFIQAAFWRRGNFHPKLRKFPQEDSKQLYISTIPPRKHKNCNLCNERLSAFFWGGGGGGKRAKPSDPHSSSPMSYSPQT